MERLMQDVRFAARVLRKRPAFTLLAVLCLALGIGANAAIFSVLDAVLIRPLPFPASARLLDVRSVVPGEDGGPVSAPDFVDWRAQSRTMELGAWNASSMSLADASGAERVPVAQLSANLLHVLRASPAIGRGFLDDEERPGRTDVVVLSDALWRRQFGGDRSVVGKSVRLDGRPFTIVGVMPRDFEFPIRTSQPAQLWTPLTLAGDSTFQQSRGAHFLTVVGRLRPGATMEQAGAEVHAIAKRLSETYPATNARFDAVVAPLHERIVGAVRPMLLMLAGAVALVLLIACANVANLMLARATVRFREIAVRSALGAGRGRIVRQLLVESIVLAMLGGAVGLLFATWGTALLASLLPAGLAGAADVGVDWRVALFALAVSVGTGLLFGLVPALQAARADLHTSLKETARGATGAGSGHRVRSAFVVVQVALSVMLVAGAGLLATSLVRLEHVDAGFRADSVITAPVQLAGSRYDSNEPVRAFYGRLLERMRALPGVRSAGAAFVLPLSGHNSMVGLVLDGHPVEPGHEVGVGWNVVTPTYFDAIGMRVARGRGFAASDDSAAVPVAVVNEAFARKYWPGLDPVGQRLSVTVGAGEMRRVVGVVADARRTALDQAAAPEVFTPFAQTPVNRMTVAIRTSGNATGIASALRREVAALDPDVALGAVRPMTDVLAHSLAPRRFTAMLIGLFAIVALVLAATGIYGVMSSMVGQRSRELAVRVALGARPNDVLGLVLRHGMLLTAVGLAAGVAGAVMLAGVLGGVLYGVHAGDPATLGGVVVLLGGVALLASWLPARRATRVDPLLALQAE